VATRSLATKPENQTGDATEDHRPDIGFLRGMYNKVIGLYPGSTQTQAFYKTPREPGQSSPANGTQGNYNVGVIPGSTGAYRGVAPV
jgi:hypothetical protein